MFQGNRIFSYSGKEIHIILKSAFADFREIESYFGVANSMYIVLRKSSCKRFGCSPNSRRENVS